MVGLGTVVVAGFVAASVFFTLVAVVGFYRLPDVYARAHAASKSETLGALFGLAAAAVALGGAGGFRLVALAVFVLVTGPTAAHAVVRAAADAGTTPWTRAPPATDGGRDTPTHATAGDADGGDPR